MIINPIPSPASVAPSSTEPSQSRVQSLRAIRMSTNANPTYVDSNQGAVPQVEQPQTEQSETDEDTRPLSPQFAALAKQKRALQVKERELQTREKALSDPSAGRDSIALARLKSEPLNVLLEAGVTYEQLTEAILADQGSSEMRTLKAEMNALKEGVDQKLSERDQQSEKQVLAEMRREAEQISAQGDDFELVRGTGSIPDVMKLIERTYRETGEVLDTKEALQLIEDELFKEAQKIAGFKKVQSHFTSQAPQLMPRHQGMRTLTNRDTASVPMSAKARALAAFSGTLKR